MNYNIMMSCWRQEASLHFLGEWVYLIRLNHVAWLKMTAQRALRIHGDHQGLSDFHADTETLTLSHQTLTHEIKREEIQGPRPICHLIRHLGEKLYAWHLSWPEKNKSGAPKSLTKERWLQSQFAIVSTPDGLLHIRGVSQEAANM